jgi:hypothetical protein
MNESMHGALECVAYQTYVEIEIQRFNLMKLAPAAL